MTPELMVTEETDNQANSNSTVSANPETSDVNLETTLSIDYTLLRDLMDAEEWEDADTLTKEVLERMLEIVSKETEKEYGELQTKDFIKLASKYLCTDLHTIDSLWVKYSSEKFGFSVQRRIFLEENENYVKLAKRIGWRYTAYGSNRWRYQFELQYSSRAPEGHLPFMFGVEEGRDLRKALFEIMKICGI